MGNCLSRILRAPFSREGSGDSSAEAGVSVVGDGGGNSNSHSFTNQVGETGNSLSSTHDAHPSPEGRGNSVPEANIQTSGHGSGNSDSHHLTDQIHNAGNSLSSIHRAHPPPPGGGDSSAEANVYIRGDFNGNTGSGNQFNSHNTNNYYGGSSSDNVAEILRCLYKSSYESHRGRVREPTEGTCTWVTEHQRYKDWSEKKGSGLLWLSADPGYGKSVTASFLITHLKTRKDAMVCYFFFKDDSDEQRSPTLALCALLHQLFSQRNSLCGYAEQALKAKDKKFTEDVETLWDILVTAVAKGGCGDVICVIDALDECEERALPPFIRHITRLSRSQNSGIPLKFLVTSRPYHRIEIELGSRTATIRLKGEDEIKAIMTDVTRVIDEGIKDLESVWGNHEDLEYLRELLRSSADRTFLWVSLILEILRNSVEGSRTELITIVTTAPADLDELYTRILSKSPDHDKARKVLNIVVAAARPLTLTEMNIALTVRRGHKSMKDLQSDFYPRFGRTVKNLCGLFVRVIDSKVYLVHQTAKEFLIKGSSAGQGNWQYSLYLKDSNFIMADICFSYLLLTEFENDPLPVDTHGIRGRELSRYLEKYRFLDYAASHWADHFRDSQDHQTELFEFTRQICEAGSQRFLTWLWVYWLAARLSYPCPKDFTHLMIASQLGQGTVVERLLEEGGDINARSEVYGTALNIAAVQRDKGITRMLLQKGVKAYLNEKEYNILHTKKSKLLSLRRRFLRLELESLRLFLRLLEEEAIKFLQDFCIPDTPDTPGNTVSPPSANLATD